MVDVVETSFDVTLDEPTRALPRPSDCSQRRVAAAVGPKAMGVVAEPLFVVWFQQSPQDFLDKFITPGRDMPSALPLLPNPLRDL
jgi:hypothetical protein